MSVEPHLGLDLPIGLIVKTGSTYEAKEFIPLLHQAVDNHPELKPQEISGDSGFDMTENYTYTRSIGAVPLIAQNPRGLTEKGKRRRGYDENGYPYAYCGHLMRPNGYDSRWKRVKFTCGKECPEEVECPYSENKMGQCVNMYLDRYPRESNEVPRGTERWEEHFDFRTACERNNRDVENHNLKRPKYRGLRNANINAHLSVISVLLTKAFTFVLEATAQFQWKDPHIRLVKTRHLSIKELITLRKELKLRWEELARAP